MKRRLAILSSLAALVSACGSSSSPTAPTPTPTVTRIISVSGDLSFGNVNIGDSPTRTFTIGNSGIGPLTFSGFTAAGGTGSTGFNASPQSGTIQPGGSQVITIRFTPTVAQFYSNVLSVTGDQTGGGAAINVSGVGVDNSPLFTASGIGDAVFDMPTKVARVRITAAPTTSCQNFVVRIGGRASIINVILGTCSVADAPSIDSTYLTGGGGVVSITISTGIRWTFTEIR